MGATKRVGIVGRVTEFLVDTEQVADFAGAVMTRLLVRIAARKRFLTYILNTITRRLVL